MRAPKLAVIRLSDSEKHISKAKIPVEVEREDGTLLMGFMFVSPQSRLSDTINDSREFLPFEDSTGKFVLLCKSSLITVTPLKQDRETYEGNDPFRILEVPEDISVAALKKSYFKLCVEHHPDKLKSLGLPEEFIELANIRMSRINEAFQRAVKLRTFAIEEAREEAEENAEPEAEAEPAAT